MKLLPALMVLLTVGACATPAAPTKDDKPATAPTPSMDKMRITNAKPFDIASCAPRPLDKEPLTAESLTGILVMARPMVQECLMNPKHHQPGDAKVALNLTVAEAGATPTVTGETLTPEGKTCIEGALARLGLSPLAAGAKPIEASVEVLLPKTSQLSMGDNIANDIVATVRLAQTSMCGCYASLGTNAPPTMKAQLKLQPGQPASVKVETVGDATLASCTEGTLKALTYPDVTQELQIPVDFQLVNSWAAAETPDASGALKFAQLDAISIQKRAEVAMAIGKRSTASLAYDEVVTRYKRKPTPGLIKELKDKCAVVLAADDGFAGALQSLMNVYNASLNVVGALKASDPAWSQVESALTQSVQQSKADIAAAETQKKNDTAACPKAK